MPDRPRVRLGKVRRKVSDTGAESYALPITRAGLEDALRVAAVQNWPLVRLVFFAVTPTEMVAYLEPRLREDFELEGSDR